MLEAVSAEADTISLATMLFFSWLIPQTIFQ
jgi:hypothetical protein